MLKYLIFVSLVFSNFSLANPSELVSEDYTKNIKELVKNGAITPREGQQQLMKIKLSSPQEQKEFNNQVRSVASKINQVKIYQFNNSPIEIQSK